ncbi:hypothetical protein ACQUSY_08350 [Microbacterium sp. YY-03]|uniref:hypothetical protein n=1 Tax=Microbacterium sp. YY-03 TaxID=3421636 RepID=UPI003D17DBA9
MTRFALRRRSLAAVLGLSAVLVLAPVATAPAASATEVSTVSSVIKPTEVYDWAEVYFGNGEIAQGQTLQVTVSDLLTGRVITATLGDGAIVVPDIPAADHYGDTGFAVVIPADFPVGVHNLTIATDEFEPIVIPITVIAGDAPIVDPTQPAPTATNPGTEQPTLPGDETEPAGSATPGTPGASQIEPPVPVTAVYGVLGGIVVIIIVTAIVRRARKDPA